MSLKGWTIFWKNSKAKIIITLLKLNVYSANKAKYDRVTPKDNPSPNPIVTILFASSCSSRPTSLYKTKIETREEYLVSNSSDILNYV